MLSLQLSLQLLLLLLMFSQRQEDGVQPTRILLHTHVYICTFILEDQMRVDVHHSIKYIAGICAGCKDMERHILFGEVYAEVSWRGVSCLLFFLACLCASLPNSCISCYTCEVITLLFTDTWIILDSIIVTDLDTPKLWNSIGTLILV